MEFGNFDDELFEEGEQKKKKQIGLVADYKPKTLTQEWFLNQHSIPSEDQDKVHFYVFRGDHHYHLGNWRDAAESYARALGSLSSTNPPMKRLLLESLARCRLKLGDWDGGVEMGESLLAESTSENQLFGTHNLLATLYHAAGRTQEEVKSLMYCLDVRPASVQHWIQLAKVHLRQIQTENQEVGSNCKQHSGLHSLSYQHTSIGREQDQRTDHQSLKSESNVTSYVCEPLHSRDSVIHEVNNHQFLEHKGNGQIRPECSSENGTGLCSVNAERSRVMEVDQKSQSTGGIIEEIGPNQGICDRTTESMRTLVLVGKNDIVSHENGAGERSSDDSTKLDTDHPAVQAATYLLRAQLILNSLVVPDIPIVKKRNADLCSEVEHLLSSLQLEPSTLAEIMARISGHSLEKEDKS